MNTSPHNDEISLKLLDTFAEESVISQRVLADRLGIALGLVNAYVKRLTKKGLIKITALPRNRIKYIVTPMGFTEKVRLTYQYMNISLRDLRDLRGKIEGAYAVMMRQGVRRVLLWGDGELAELSFISTRGLPLEIVAVVSNRSNGADFFGKPLAAPEEVLTLSFDAVLMCSTDRVFNESVHMFVADAHTIYYLEKSLR